MSELRRIDILKPPGQRFAIGELVKLHPISGWNREVPPNTKFRIQYSYAQRHRAHRDTPQVDGTNQEYSIINVETGAAHSWVREEELVRVPEVLDQLKEVEQDLRDVRALFRSALNQNLLKPWTNVEAELHDLRKAVLEVLENRLADLEPDPDIEKDDEGLVAS